MLFGFCGSRTRNYNVRGCDRALREAQRIGTTPTTRTEADGCRACAIRGRTAVGRLARYCDAPEEAAPARRAGEAASCRALWSPGAVVLFATRGADADDQGWFAGGRICDGSVATAKDYAIDRGRVPGLDGGLLRIAAVWVARRDDAPTERLGTRARRTGDLHPKGQVVPCVRKIAARLD